MEIVKDVLTGAGIAAFSGEHIEEMNADAPRPESKHALDLEGLRAPDITVWTVWHEGLLVGCGALKELDEQNAEIKSMRTSSGYRRNGVASALLDHLLRVARARGYRSLSLETGSFEFSAPARALYEKFGFEYCAPFADYEENPDSVFMKKSLG